MTGNPNAYFISQSPASLRTSLSQDIDTLFTMFGMTAAEIALGVVIVNPGFLPGYVDRYGINAIPGTTSMAAAYQTAVNVAKKGGQTDVILGPTMPYLIDAPIDYTTPVGQTTYSFTTKALGHMAAFTTNAPFHPQIIFKHNSHAFDTTGNLGLNFENLGITCDTGTFPKTGFFLARNTDARSQVVRFNNVRVFGAFSDSIIYNYGSENDVHIGCQYINSNIAAGSKTIRHTANNVSAFTTAFPGSTTIATGSQSTIDHTYVGCQLENLSANATADLIYYDGAADVRFISCWAYMAGGRAMHYHDGTNASTQSVSFRDWITESISGQNYFADFSNNAGTISGWHFDNIVSYSASNFIHTEGASPVLDEFWIGQILDVNNHGINIAGTLQNSIVTFFQPITIGTSSGNILNGNAPGWTITTRTADKWFDWASGVITWTPNLSGLTTATGVTFSSNRIQYDGQTITFNIQLNIGTALVSAAGQQITGLPKPTAVNGAEVSIVNANTNASIGGAFITGSGITLPVINLGPASLIISGRYFAA